ncbi:hypothetical protein [Blastococcus sp. SYSU DS1024]
MRIRTRRQRDRDLGGLIHHSGQAVHYVAVRHTQRLAEASAVVPVGSAGDSYDDALTEPLNLLIKA